MNRKLVHNLKYNNTKTIFIMLFDLIYIFIICAFFIQKLQGLKVLCIFYVITGYSLLTQNLTKYYIKYYL